MKTLLLIFALLSLSLTTFAQNDSLNRFDKKKHKQGLCQTFYSNGKLKSEITYLDNVPNGKAKLYYENGKIAEEGIWLVNHWVGEYKAFYENGDIKLIGKWKPEMKTRLFATKIHTTTPKDPLLKTTDTLEVKTEIKKSEEDLVLKYGISGYFKLYTYNRIDRDGDFENGKFIKGKRYYYDEKGKLIKTEIYKKGKVIETINN